MKINNKFYLFVTVFCLLVIPAAQAADEGATGKEAFFQKRFEDKEKVIQEIYDQLNLNEQQKSQLEQNKSKTREEKKAMRERMKAFHHDIREELMKPELDMNKINEIQAKLKTAHAQMDDQRLNSILEVRKILTQEQFEKFINLMDEKKKDFKP